MPINLIGRGRCGKPEHVGVGKEHAGRRVAGQNWDRREGQGQSIGLQVLSACRTGAMPEMRQRLRMGRHGAPWDDLAWRKVLINR